MTRKDYTKIAEIIKYLTDRDCESLTDASEDYYDPELEDELD